MKKGVLKLIPFTHLDELTEGKYCIYKKELVRYVGKHDIVYIPTETNMVMCGAPNLIEDMSRMVVEISPDEIVPVDFEQWQIALDNHLIGTEVEFSLFKEEGYAKIINRIDIFPDTSLTSKEICEELINIIEQPENSNQAWKDSIILTARHFWNIKK